MGGREKIFSKRDTIPSLLNRLVERKRVNKAFLLQRFSTLSPLVARLSPHSTSRFDTNQFDIQNKIIFQFFAREILSADKFKFHEKNRTSHVLDAAYQLLGYIEISC